MVVVETWEVVVCWDEVVEVVVVVETWLTEVVEVVEAVPVAEAGNSSTLLKPSSATQRFPAESSAMPSGVSRLL